MIHCCLPFSLQGFQYMELEANLNEEGTDVYGAPGCRCRCCCWSRCRRRRLIRQANHVLLCALLEGCRCACRGLPGAAAAAAAAAGGLFTQCLLVLEPMPLPLPSRSAAGEYTPLQARDILVKDIDELKVGPTAVDYRLNTKRSLTVASSKVSRTALYSGLVGWTNKRTPLQVSHTLAKHLVSSRCSCSLASLQVPA